MILLMLGAVILAAAVWSGCPKSPRPIDPPPPCPAPSPAALEEFATAQVDRPHFKVWMGRLFLYCKSMDALSGNEP